MKSDKEDELSVQLPMRRCTIEDVCGVLFPICPPEDLWKDALLKLQTWILNYAEEQVSVLRECGALSDEEIEKIKSSIAVISPITMTLYAHWVQERGIVKIPDAEKEKWLFDRLPDRFKARFKANEGNRKSREVTAEELAASEEEEKELKAQAGRFTIEDVIADLRAVPQPDYILAMIGKA